MGPHLFLALIAFVCLVYAGSDGFGGDGKSDRSAKLAEERRLDQALKTRTYESAEARREKALHARLDSLDGHLKQLVAATEEIQGRLDRLEDAVQAMGKTAKK